jgi:uncharacterized integral membrane protein
MDKKEGVLERIDQLIGKLTQLSQDEEVKVKTELIKLKFAIVLIIFLLLFILIVENVL